MQVDGTPRTLMKGVTKYGTSQESHPAAPNANAKDDIKGFLQSGSVGKLDDQKKKPSVTETGSTNITTAKSIDMFDQYLVVLNYFLTAGIILTITGVIILAYCTHNDIVLRWEDVIDFLGKNGSAQFYDIFAKVANDFMGLGFHK